MNKRRGLIYSMSAAVCLFAASCEYDLNAGVDFISPQAVIATDTMEVARGGEAVIVADIHDESGLSYISLAYADWGVSDTRTFEERAYPESYHYSYTVRVPDNAVYEWEEVYTKNDGSKFNIMQQYHKLSLTCYDGVRNKHVFYYYIKVK